MTTPDRNIAVYRGGVLQALFMDWRRLTMRLSPRWWRPEYTARELRLIRLFARQHNWRAIRMQFSGWHAEHAYAGTRAGHGWTRSRALADLRRHLDEHEHTGSAS